jgi:transcriptional regulator with XRE-family HTH domain
LKFNPALLRKARSDAGFTLKELAERSGVGFTTIHYLESGRVPDPRTQTVLKLATALGVNWLVFFENENRKSDNSASSPNPAA